VVIGACTAAFLAVGSFTVVTLADSATSAPDRVPEEKVALEVLRDVVNTTRSGDVDQICGMGGSRLLCLRLLEGAGGLLSVPRKTPQIVRSFALHSQGNSVAGRVLVVKGTDGLGRSFLTDFLVFMQGSDAVPQSPIYWSGYGIQRRESDGSYQTPSLPSLQRTR
jgi:hypothetical protein